MKCERPAVEKKTQPRRRD